MDTGYYMTRWLEGPPPWEDDHVFKMVNGYHNNAAQKFREMTREERRSKAVEKITQLSPEDKYPNNEPLDEAFLVAVKDFRDRVFADTNFPIYDRYIDSDVVFSQFDMALVQIAFFASVVVFPM